MLAGVANHRAIKHVMILDDNPNARRVMAFNVADAELNPIDEPGPLPELDDFVRKVIDAYDAIICDHRLQIGRYAHFDGAQAVARFYTAGFPAVLCTNYSQADIDTIRRYRRNIPSLMRTDDVAPEAILEGFDRCLQEFSGQFAPSRKPWRTLVRIEDVNLESTPKMMYVVLPAWGSSERIRLPLDLIPAESRERMVPGYRFHAQVNIGADDPNALYFDGFEID